MNLYYEFHIRHHLILKSHSPIVFITVKKAAKKAVRIVCLPPPKPRFPPWPPALRPERLLLKLPEPDV